ncbi:peptide-methionine (R)-S-oxide reductase MsrB [archaeon]|jgi:peptide-methionine (R)-S-oxide reductase|nr:peptide-methionine (R)-S-oxide reductase MsrB [archaeon]MBT6698265.1 peptide-methionine (R)-S-oxide reductase MsrB [archaeon]
MEKVVKSEKQWKAELDADSYRVLRESGTEAAFSGEYDHFKSKGKFKCKACGLNLFDSDSKFDSGCGWPAFSDVSESKNVKLLSDNSHGMKRVEVRCARCDSHLGHVFDDGPKEKGGKRYCINSCSLGFEKA